MTLTVPRLARLAALAVGLSFAGCGTPPALEDWALGPFYTPSNVTGVDRLPVLLRRVALLPVHVERARPEAQADLDRAFAAELNKTARFEVAIVSREWLQRLYGRSQFSSTEALPPDLFAVIAREFGADGVLFIDATHLSPYVPLSLGVRAKLATLEEREIVWAFDNVFDASNSAVANSARRHFKASGLRRSAADVSGTALQSPARFASYAAAATFATLPVR